MNHPYAALLDPFPQISAETNENYHCVTERHLQAVWYEQKYFRNLKTSDGQDVKVISPGIWNGEAGPDFLKAHLKIGNKEFRGDVEIHLSPGSWKQHHHHIDSRYNHVVFHLSLWKQKKEQSITTQKGKWIHQAFLENILTIPLGRIVQLINLDLYPYKKFVGSGRCSQALFHSLPKKKVESFFQLAADWRLQQKRIYLKTQAPNTSLLSTGIALALGYKHNSEAFLKLFHWLQNRLHLKESEMFASCLGMFGFFKKTYQKRWSDSEYYRSLINYYDGLLPSISLKLSQVRPFNHPIRRLVYMIKMVRDSTIEERLTTMKALWEMSWPDSAAKTLRKQLFDLIPDHKDPYWNSHYLFETDKKEVFLPLIGQHLKTAILVNTFLPLLHDEVERRGNPIEFQAFNNFYGSFAASKSSKTKYLSHRFFGNTQKTSILNNAKTEQGAYQLHRDFCMHFEASCEGCPFVQRYKSLLK